MAIFVSRLFRWKRSIVGKRVSIFPFSYSTWKETNLVLLSLAVVTLRSWLQMLFRKVQKSQQNMLSRGSIAIWKLMEGYRINKAISGLLSCWLMSLAERCPCPRSFASQPNSHFSLSHGHCQSTYQSPEGVCLLIIIKPLWDSKVSAYYNLLFVCLAVTSFPPSMLVSGID